MVFNLKDRFKFRFNPRGHGLSKVLGHREAQIMNIIWGSGPVTVAQVHDQLGKKHGLAYTTIMTIMSRLEKKGLLERTASGRAYIYSATVSREEFSASVVSGLLDGLLADFTRPALAYFVKQAEDEKALDELDKLIQERKIAREK